MYSSCIFEIIDQTIKSSKTSLPVKGLCQLAGVSRSGYYAWVKAAPVRAQQDREDFELVLAGYKMHGYSKCVRGNRMALEHMNPPVIMKWKICLFIHNTGCFYKTSAVICDQRFSGS